MKFILVFILSMLIFSCVKNTEIENKDEQKKELNRFIGEPYKRHNPKSNRTCVRECK